ncbi:MAG: ABC transporter permease subunit [Lysinibacillus sp.]|nr:ABC transporter permease subunit [Lysinibacillus sp.]
MHYVWKEWKENVKGKGLWISFGIIVLVSLFLLFKSSSLSFEQGIYILQINLFDMMIYLIPIFCLFLGAFSLFQEKEQKTLIMLLTRRDTFTGFLLKKTIAVQTLLIIPIVAWFLIYLLPIKFLFEIDFISYGALIVSFICLTLVFTQLGMMIGSVSRSIMQIVGFAVAIWFYFFFLHDFILLSFLSDVSYDNVKFFSIVYFLNPISAARIFLESALGTYNFDHMSKLLQTFMWLKPGIFLLINVCFYMIVSFAIGVVFHRKEGKE